MTEASLKPDRRNQFHAEAISKGFPSITALARDIEVSQSLMNAIINGWRYPGPQTQDKICKALGINHRTLGRLLDNEAD